MATEFCRWLGAPAGRLRLPKSFAVSWPPNIARAT